MSSVQYVGGRDAVDVKLPSRWLLGVVRGESVEVTDDEAARLLAIPGWESALDPTASEEDD